MDDLGQHIANHSTLRLFRFLRQDTSDLSSQSLMHVHLYVMA
jgi:hypothetical protein